MTGVAGAGGARQGILSLAIKDKAALYNAYMPYLKSGGIFVPTPKRYFLGDDRHGSTRRRPRPSRPRARMVERRRPRAAP